MAGELLDYAPFDEGRSRRRGRPAGLDHSFTFGSGASFIVAHSDITMSNLVAKPGIDQVVLSFDYTDTNTNPLWQIAAVEVWIAKVNDRTQASEFGESTDLAMFTHNVRADEGIRYYWIRARDGAGNVGAWFPSSDTAGVQAAANKTPNIAGLNFNLANGKIVASVASNNLTLAIKTEGGNDPSSSDPVFVNFRKVDGNYIGIKIDYALSITLSSGFTFNNGNDIAFRVYLLAINDDDNNVVRLGVYEWTYTNAPVPQLDEAVPVSSLANTTSSAGPGVVYTTTGQPVLSNKAFRILGFLDWNSGLPNEAAGLWSLEPDEIELFHASSKKPGDVVAFRSAAFGRHSGTTIIPFDNSVPINTEGFEIGTLSYTPRSPVNYFVHNAIVPMAHDAPSEVMLTLFRDSESAARRVAYNYCAAANKPVQVSMKHVDRAQTTLQITAKFRAGAAVAGTLTVVGVGGADVFIASASGYIEIIELNG